MKSPVSALKRRRRVGNIYTRGEANALIDATLHPLARRDGRVYILDTLFHFLIEGDPSESATKFMKYNLPSILSKIEGTDAGMVSASNRLLRQVMRFSRQLHGRGPKIRRASKRSQDT